MVAQVQGFRGWFVLAGVSLTAALIASCGSERRGFDDGNGNGGPGGNGSLTSDDVIEVQPADVVLDVEEGKPAPTVDYKALLVHKNGTKEDVTTNTSFHFDGLGSAPIGNFAGPKFIANADGVGKASVKADYKTISGSTSLTLRLNKVIIASGAPADAPSKFGGPVSATGGPTIVYPADGVMMPPNMNVMEWHYQPGAGNDLFELGVTSTLLKLKVYFTCGAAVGGGCAYAPEQNVWNILSNAGRGQDPMDYELRGTKAAGGPVSASAKQKISFGEEDILGGIYYWNAGAGSTMRYEFGVSGQKAELFMNAGKAGASQCVGCHVLSRDGERISVGLDIPSPSPYKVFEVGSRNMVFAQGSAFGGGGANFFTFSPDKNQMMVSNGITLSLRDAKSGAAVVENVGPGAMPDWSPDGSSIVIARPKQSPPCFAGACGSPGVGEASLFVLKNNGSGWAAANPIVASSSNNNYYPSYSPDGGWIVFNRASIGTNAQGEAKSSYDAPDATVWVVGANGGNAIALAKASNDKTNGDSWPKWMQREQNYRGKKLMWLTFSSRRAYGLRQAAGGNAQIWMVAFDPEAAAQGKDPAYAAFWLPFQDMASGNHIAQWVTRVVREGCTDQSQCEGTEVCSQGVCMPSIK